MPPTPKDVFRNQPKREPVRSATPRPRHPPQPRPVQPEVASSGRAAGPLGRVLGVQDERLVAWIGGKTTPSALPGDANAAILLRRAAFLALAGRTGDELGLSSHGRHALLAWAGEHQLGQQSAGLPDVTARREAAVKSLLEQRTATRADTVHERLILRPEWHLLVGASDSDGPHGLGLTVHGTYGWPMLPASTLKGAARAVAADSGVDPGDITRVCGPDPGLELTGQGSVVWFDALPGRAGVHVVQDGQTPHQQPYYRDPTHATPPAEWHSPVPVPFLAIDGGEFVLDLLGPRADVLLAASWVRNAVDDLGVGAKTAAGYGYLVVSGA